MGNNIVTKPKPPGLHKSITPSSFSCTCQLSTRVKREVRFMIVLERSSPHISSGKSLWLVVHRHGNFLAEVMNVMESLLSLVKADTWL